MTEIPELTAEQFQRAIPPSVRRRLMAGHVESGADVTALRRFIGQTLTDLRLNYTEENRRARETSDHPDTEPGIVQG